MNWAGLGRTGLDYAESSRLGWHLGLPFGFWFECPLMLLGCSVGCLWVPHWILFNGLLVRLLFPSGFPLVLLIFILDFHWCSFGARFTLDVHGLPFPFSLFHSLPFLPFPSLPFPSLPLIILLLINMHKS